MPDLENSSLGGSRRESAFSPVEEERFKAMTAAMMPPVPTFTCPVCTHKSSHPRDVLEGYCGACHRWTGQEWQVMFVIMEAVRGALAGIPDVLPQTLVREPPDALVVDLGDMSFRVFVRALRPAVSEPVPGVSFLCTRLTDILEKLLPEGVLREGPDTLIVEIEGREHRVSVVPTRTDEVVTRVMSAREKAGVQLREYLALSDDGAQETRERVAGFLDLMGVA